MPIGTDEERFEATFKFRTKIGGLEIYDFLIKPKGDKKGKATELLLD